jgi:hypothetical protein
MYRNIYKFYGHALGSSNEWRTRQVSGQGSITLKRSFPFKLKFILRLSFYILTREYVKLSNSIYLIHKMYSL